MKPASRQTGSRLTLISGSFPPDKCGVGDYTAQLLQGFRAIGVDAHCYAERDWRLHQLGKHWLHLCRTPGALLIQHPTAGFDKRFAPFLLWPLLFWKTKLVTLHEFSKKTRVGKLLCYAFFIFSYRIIFTNDTERREALRFAPWLARRSDVIPIGSNIPFAARREPTADIVYFGLILPGKGLEEFLQIIEGMDPRCGFRISLIGQVFKGAEVFAEQVFSRLQKLGAHIILNADAETVAQHLAATRVVLLPFPDGISSRRGSALAAMGNGALVVSTTSKAEPDIFAGRCLMGDTLEQLTRLAIDALTQPDKYAGIAAAGQQYAQSFDWTEIANRHVALWQGERSAVIDAQNRSRPPSDTTCES